MISINSGYTFNYDREGRLEEIIEAVADDTNKFTFSYTSEGRRFRKIHLVDTGGVVTADTTYYVYDGMFAVAELDGHLDLKSKYVYTNGMLVGRIDSSGEFYQYFHDGLGSVTMICDSSGTFQNLYIYDDFGDFRSKEEGIPNHYCYTGQERDENPSGLYNLRARYYVTGIGRFTQEDPVFGIEKEISDMGCSSSLERMRVISLVPQDNNRYLYARNNPVIFTDITGEYCGPGPFDLLVRDKYLGCDFSEACKNHDECYNDCHNGDLYWKHVCDEQFQEDMQKVTNKSRWFFQQACEWQAMVYHSFVRDYGDRAYRISQEKGCRCK